MTLYIILYHLCIKLQKTNAASMRETVNLTSFSLLTAVISLSQFLSFFESREKTIVEFFFCHLSKWECKQYL